MKNHTPWKVWGITNTITNQAKRHATLEYWLERARLIEMEKSLPQQECASANGWVCCLQWVHYRDNARLLEILWNTARCTHPLDEYITQDIKTAYWLCAVRLLLQEIDSNVPAENVTKRNTFAAI
jgi:type II secretory pathway component PulJ